MHKAPTFIVIGAGKSGTTTLNAMLSSHPQIYMSPLKEPCYFCWEELDPTVNKSAIRSKDAYYKLFSAISFSQICGVTNQARATRCQDSCDS